MAAPLSAAAGAWLARPWLLWGVGPVLASHAGFFLTAVALELVLWSGWADSRLICYPSKSGDAPRKQLLAATHKRLPLWKQARGCVRLLLGPSQVVNGAALVLMMRLAGPPAAGWLPPSLLAGAVQLVALVVLNDFGLYWGHRAQHESELLWRLHSKHHSIDTPTPLSTLFIDPTDAALQGSLPMGIAAALLRPAPAVFYLFVALRVAENAVNHSGIDSPLLDLLTLKSLPGRAGVAFHDSHHKYCCHSKNARNYAEGFWLWDWAFGTLSPIRGRAAAVAAAERDGAAAAAQ